MTGVQISLAAFPGLRHEQAAHQAISAIRSGHLAEPVFGKIECQHVQLVPQCGGILDESLCDGLKLAFPECQFRLHANARVIPERARADISGLSLHPAWFRQAAQISRRLDAPAYTGHSGMRSEASFKEMLDNARRIEDMFGCPVGIEGQYPSDGDRYLVSTWQEYRLLFESGVHYALDLSHINILARLSGRQEATLLGEMLSCERCIEVHVSENDGTGDWHQICDAPPWWLVLLRSLHSRAVVFTEGNHRRRRQVPEATVAMTV